jgi:hypothetical protein
MPRYTLGYRGRKKPESPDGGAKHFANLKAWLAGLGDAAVNRGTPLGQSKIVGSAGESGNDGSDPLTGYSIVKADSTDAALEIARACPHLDLEGTIEVAQLMEMEM